MFRFRQFRVNSYGVDAAAAGLEGEAAAPALVVTLDAVAVEVFFPLVESPPQSATHTWPSVFHFGT